MMGFLYCMIFVFFLITAENIFLLRLLGHCMYLIMYFGPGHLLRLIKESRRIDTWIKMIFRIGRSGKMSTTMTG